MRSRSALRPWVAAAAVALMLAACGSDDADTAGTESETSSVGSAPTGDPLKIGVINDVDNPVAQTPEIPESAQAVAAYLNAEAGGIAGRPVEIVSCNEAADPSTAAACAQEFVDEGVVAVAGLGAVWSANGVPILEDAGILNITSPVGGEEFTSPVSYPLTGGAPTGAATMVKFMVAEGVESAAAIYVDVGSAKTMAEQGWCGGLAAAGVTECTAVPIAGDAADFTPAVQQAVAGDPDVVFVLFAPAQCARIIEAANELGALEGDIKWAMVDACADETNFFEPLGELTEGLYFNSDKLPTSQTDDPEVALYLRILEEYGDGMPPSGLAGNLVATVMTLATIGNELGADHLTSADFLSYMETVSGLHVFMGSELNADETVPDLPNLRSVRALILQQTDGELVVVSDGFIDAFAD